MKSTAANRNYNGSLALADFIVESGILCVGNLLFGSMNWCMSNPSRSATKTYSVTGFSGVSFSTMLEFQMDQFYLFRLDFRKDIFLARTYLLMTR